MTTVISLISGKEFVADDYFFHLQRGGTQFHVFFDSIGRRMYEVEDQNIECIESPLTEEKKKMVIEAANRAPVDPYNGDGSYA